MLSAFCLSACLPALLWDSGFWTFFGTFYRTLEYFRDSPPPIFQMSILCPLILLNFENSQEKFKHVLIIQMNTLTDQLIWKHNIQGLCKQYPSLHEPLQYLATPSPGVTTPSLGTTTLVLNKSWLWVWIGMGMGSGVLQGKGSHSAGWVRSESPFSSSATAWMGSTSLPVPPAHQCRRWLASYFPVFLHLFRHRHFGAAQLSVTVL